jgi:hypothetical protein
MTARTEVTSRPARRVRYVQFRAERAGFLPAVWTGHVRHATTAGSATITVAVEEML